MDKPIELLMVNVNDTPIDLIHQVTCHPGTIWENPYNTPRSFVDQNNNYRKYTHFLANALFLNVQPQKNAYNELLERAIKEKKLVFECTCFPGPCHLDALRLLLITDLTAKGYNIKTNQTNSFGRNLNESD